MKRPAPEHKSRWRPSHLSNTLVLPLQERPLQLRATLSPSSKLLYGGSVSSRVSLRHSSCIDDPHPAFSGFRSGTGALKLPSHHLSSRSSTPDTTTTRHSPRTVREWEFSGWGSTSFEEISSEQIDEAKRERAEEKKKAGDGTLGAWMASAVAGVAVAGSPLYAFPPLVAVGGIYSPISLLIATLLLWLWRPIMEELASALAFDGANYVYLCVFLHRLPPCALLSR